MKRINNSNFETIQDIIKGLDLKYNPQKDQQIKSLAQIWKDIAGKKISRYSKVYDFSDNNILTVACSDSVTANELYLGKEKIQKYINEKIQNLGIIIKDIRFDYKKWKENSDE